MCRPKAALWISAGAIASLLGCTVQRGSSAPPENSAAGAGREAEVFHAHSQRQPAQAMLQLPGASAEQLVTYQVVDGMAVMEGDIVLGRADNLLARFGAQWLSGHVKGAVAVSDRSALWPNSEIPYEIHASAHNQRDKIQWAIDHLSTTSLKVRPRRAGDNDYVVFSNQDEGCWSYLGRVRGPQEIQISTGCARGTVVHEILHAAGFLHEQSRSDRDQHVTIVWDEIIPGARSNFEMRPGTSYDVGAYDYASILHYSERAFSRSGRPTIIPKAEGARIGLREGLSTLDRAAIEEIYGNGAPPPPTPGQPAAPPPPPTVAPPAAVAPPGPSPVNQGFAGEYTSAQGNVSCSQTGTTVQCRYPTGTLMCVARGDQLDCGWTGGGVGRAAFQRQPNGVVAGTWGDAFSNSSRGAWDWTPASAPTAPPTAPAPSTPPPTAPTPPTAPAPSTPAPGPTSLAGNYQSTRGPMTCTETANSWNCNFQDPSGAAGQLHCSKDASGLQLSCTWVTFLPQPGGGRAVFTRANASSRTLQGTWGHLQATTGGGTWEAQGQ